MIFLLVPLKEIEDHLWQRYNIFTAGIMIMLGSFEKKANKDKITAIYSLF
jgi:hypothetical protein